MEKVTKIQISEELEKVPSVCMVLLENKVLKELDIVHSELDHLRKVHRHNGATPEQISWHIEQVRLRLYNVDVHLHDIHSLAENFKTYKLGESGQVQEALTSLQETISNLEEEEIDDDKQTLEKQEPDKK